MFFPLQFVYLQLANCPYTCMGKGYSQTHITDLYNKQNVRTHARTHTHTHTHTHHFFLIVLIVLLLLFNIIIRIINNYSTAYQIILSKKSLSSLYFHSMGSDISGHFFWSEYRVNRTRFHSLSSEFSVYWS